jgi:hypothetical protein
VSTIPLSISGDTITFFNINFIVYNLLSFIVVRVVSGLIVHALGLGDLAWRSDVGMGETDVEAMQSSSSMNAEFYL